MPLENTDQLIITGHAPKTYGLYHPNDLTNGISFNLSMTFQINFMQIIQTTITILELAIAKTISQISHLSHKFWESPSLLIGAP